MKQYTLPIATVMALAAAAVMVNAASEMDENGDGLLSYNELLTAYPDLTEEVFIAADVNSDGALDEAEVAAAQEAGLLPKNG